MVYDPEFRGPNPLGWFHSIMEERGFCMWFGLFGLL